MEILASITAYVGQLLWYVFLVTLVCIIAAVLISRFAHRRGWFSITSGGPAAYKTTAWIAALALAVFIGITSGLQISITLVGMNIINDSGSALIKSGLAMSASVLGRESINQPINIEDARTMIKAVREVDLVENGGWKGRLVNAVFDRIKLPFADTAEATLQHYVPDSRVVPAELVDKVWLNVYATVTESSRKVTMMLAFQGMMWLVAAWLIIILFTAVLRWFYTKGQQVKV